MYVSDYKTAVSYLFTKFLTQSEQKHYIMFSQIKEVWKKKMLGHSLCHKLLKSIASILVYFTLNIYFTSLCKRHLF